MMLKQSYKALLLFLFFFIIKRKRIFLSAGENMTDEFVSSGAGFLKAEFRKLREHAV